ncbi:MAG: hypothetical protein E7014_02530 [Alphaproteobacteria bacterium]|nr:hypothetical protein [Alphaproteobacteria bacterium]
MPDVIQEVNILNDDHTMSSFINGDPFEALTQIIHNSLDADANTIKISIKCSALGIIEWIKVIDNGSGIKQPNKDNPMDPFLRRGYSEKKSGQVNIFSRNVHGKNGEGRFKSYALGGHVEWISKRADSTTCKIMGNYMEPQKFKYINNCDTPEITSRSGTIFTAYADDRNIKLPNHDKLKENLERHFVTIVDDSRISIYLDSEKLSAQPHIDSTETQTLDQPYEDVETKTIIWKQQDTDNNKLFWCDSGYNILKEDKLENGNKKTNFSLYIASQRVEEAKNNNTLDLISSNQDFIEIEQRARDKKDEFLLKQRQLHSYDIIKKLKEENIYPYQDSQSSSEQVARNLYDRIIVKIHEKKPNVLKTKETRQFIVSTVKVLLEREPEHFANILQKLLNLTSEETSEFSKLLDETDLSNIIKTSTMVSNRLKFLEALRMLVYGDIADKVKERSQLHKIVAREAWIFGEEYNLQASDKTFDTTISEIRKTIPNFCGEYEVEGGSKIPDLFFTSKRFFADQPWALIVELKRPKVSIGIDEVQQIKNYYNILKKRPEFANWKIDFIVVSSDIDQDIYDGEIKDKRTGLLRYSEENLLKKIYVKRWGDILDQNNCSYANLKLSLDMDMDQDNGAQYIRDNFADIIDLDSMIQVSKGNAKTSS